MRVWGELVTVAVGWRGECGACAARTGRGVVLVVVLELLWGGGLAEVEGEGVEDVLLGVGECRVLRDCGAR